MGKVGLVILLAGVALGFGNPLLAREGGEGHRGVGGGGTEKRDPPPLWSQKPESKRELKYPGVSRCNQGAGSSRPAKTES